MQVAEAAAKIETEDSVPRDRLVDLSAMEGMSVNFDQMNAFAEKRRSSPQMRKARTAIFAPQDLQFGLARMFQTLGAHPLLEIQVFRDLPAAVRWLEGAE